MKGIVEDADVEGGEVDVKGGEGGKGEILLRSELPAAGGHEEADDVGVVVGTSVEAKVDEEEKSVRGRLINWEGQSWELTKLVRIDLSK